MQEEKTSDDIRIERRMSVSPQGVVPAFKNRREVEWKERISKHVLGDIQVLDIVQMKRLLDERQVNRKRQGDQQQQVPCCPRWRGARFVGFELYCLEVCVQSESLPGRQTLGMPAS